MANKMIFRTAYQWDRGEKTPHGTKYQNVYEYQVDQYGRRILKKTGEKDLYAEIQENLEETKIENILKKVAIGDTSGLRPDGSFIDTTQLPNNLIEARQQMQNLENLWNGLSAEIKRKYDNDVEKFIGASGTESWLKDMGLLKESQEKVSEAVTEAPKKEAVKDE